MSAENLFLVMQIVIPLFLIPCSIIHPLQLDSHLSLTDLGITAAISRATPSPTFPTYTSVLVELSLPATLSVPANSTIQALQSSLGSLMETASLGGQDLAAGVFGFRGFYSSSKFDYNHYLIGMPYAILELATL